MQQLKTVLSKFSVFCLFDLIAKNLGLGDCPALCVNGECKESRCLCKSGFFGRACDK